MLSDMTDCTRLTELPVTFESQTKISPVAKVTRLVLTSVTNADLLVTKFEDAGLHPVMLANVQLCGYKIPTPIQAYCFPSVLKGIDIIGIAQTGMYYVRYGLIQPLLMFLQDPARRLLSLYLPSLSLWVKRRS